MLTTPHNRSNIGCLFAEGACKRLQVQTTAHGKAHNADARYRSCVCVCHVPSGKSVDFGPTNWPTPPAPSHAFHHPPSAKHPQWHCGIMLALPVASGGSDAERHRPTPPRSEGLQRRLAGNQWPPHGLKLRYEMISRVQRIGKELGSGKGITMHITLKQNYLLYNTGPWKFVCLCVCVDILPGYAYRT